MQPKSYLLISLDAVRADVAYSGKFPTLERLRSEGVQFSKVVSSSPLTPVSHASILSGLHPYHHGIRHLFREALADQVVTLAEHFARAGYACGAIVSCPGMNSWYGFHRGFAHYDDEIPRLPDGSNPLLSTDVALRGLAAKRADQVVDRALSWLGQQGEIPIFIFLHFFDAHWLYAAPEPFGSRFRDRPYEGEVAFMDAQLGRLRQGLINLGLERSFTWIVTADHGEDLEGIYANDHGGKQFGNPHERGHGCLLYGATQYVPLILFQPESNFSGLEITKQVRSIDIAPTLLDLAGLEYLTQFDGISLLPYLEGQGRNLPAYSETFYPEEYQGSKPPGKSLRPLRSLRLVLGGAEVAVIWGLGDDSLEIYDLKNDPLERNNLFPSKSGDTDEQD